MSLDEHDFAAKRVLTRLTETEGVEFVSSRGAAALAGAAAHFLLGHERDAGRAEAFADWLIEQVEVADLFVDNEALERLLVDEWDRGAQPRGPAVVARNVELEAQLLDAPDDLELYLVYGDWLQARGDAYGEWVTRQIAAQRPGAAPELEPQTDAHSEAQAFALLGPLAEYLDQAVHLDWHMGFIRRARVGKEPGDKDNYEGAILLRWLLEHRASLLLRELDIESLWPARSGQLVGMIEVLAASPPKLLERLTIGQGDAGELSRLLAALPELRELEIGTDRVQLGELFGGVLVPKLRRLRVRGSFELLERLASSPLLARLEQLDLSGGDLDDEAIETLLVPTRARFRHLKQLVLHQNALTEAGTELVMQALASVEVVIGTQNPTDEFDEDDYEDSLA